MRKSTGSDRVKILPNESFGFLRVTVERPLRRTWQVTGETLTLLGQSKPWIKASMVSEPREVLSELIDWEWASESDLLSELAAYNTIPLPARKELVKLAAVADPAAPVITNRKGEPEPDPDLRDQENVPLPAGALRYEPDPTGRLASSEYVEATENHLQTEVHPYVSDAWIDHTKTKIGYEIPLTRHFYTYVPPRPLSEIDAEIKQLETEIQGLIREVTE